MQVGRAKAVLALGLALGVLGGQLAESAHDPFAHVVCPEHGDTLHAERSGLARPTSDQPSLDSTKAKSEHDRHCGHAVLVGQSQGIQALAPPASPTTGRVARLRPVPSLPIALLRLAPKASPPTLV